VILRSAQCGGTEGFGPGSGGSECFPWSACTAWGEGCMALAARPLRCGDGLDPVVERVGRADLAVVLGIGRSLPVVSVALLIVLLHTCGWKSRNQRRRDDEEFRHDPLVPCTGT
jgi:hypothetical protein